eukprot:CAMPEP_0197388900 /NCGR_PEP_ID=MMETSP1165-20131217/1318_1 /TAXON_ID=284809 /ORGANISM="Chrysocystis fragilis, Strain CCMP3189" /LENGTH=297 /DNA_ID=CAMNT_0042914255 /DNA_START=118 /DNA_END=1009 /DNA_ORIENTATION=+
MASSLAFGVNFVVERVGVVEVGFLEEASLHEKAEGELVLGDEGFLGVRGGIVGVEDVLLGGVANQGAGVEDEGGEDGEEDRADEEEGEDADELAELALGGRVAAADGGGGVDEPVESLGDGPVLGEGDGGDDDGHEEAKAGKALLEAEVGALDGDPVLLLVGEEEGGDSDGEDGPDDEDGGELDEAEREPGERRAVYAKVAVADAERDVAREVDRPEEGPLLVESRVQRDERHQDHHREQVEVEELGAPRVDLRDEVRRDAAAAQHASSSSSSPHIDDAWASVSSIDPYAASLEAPV